MSRRNRVRWIVTATCTLAVTFGQSGVANAATFDVDGYTACTASAAPGPDFDGYVTTCCVEHAGVPADTRFGVGCVAPMDNPSVDYRPTIVLPARPGLPGVGDDGSSDLIELPDPLP